jgi:MFS superfamily sulfate permease-like transporter
MRLLSALLGAEVDAASALFRALLPTLVVFLVALPLSLGVALASGVPPAYGLVSAIVGGLVVGRLAGSPLQVSGPAAGLAVLVWDLVQTYGLSSLGAIVLLAGALQLVAGGLGLGRWFRAVSPAVVRGMLAGIGLLILASQLHVVLGGSPTGTGLGDWAALPAAVSGVFGGGVAFASAALGFGTIAVMLGWERWRPAALEAVPAALVGVAGVSAVAVLVGLPVAFVTLPESLVGSLTPVTPAGLLAAVQSPAIWGAAAALAAVASAEALLSATAVDQLHDGVRTDYDQELVAQGAGNLVAGALGVLPVTGVIVRSSANVASGATNRLPAMFHALAMLGLVVAAPWLLEAIPVTVLAAVLVLMGVRLVAVRRVAELWRMDRTEALILVATAGLIVGTDLLTGVVAGLLLAAARLSLRVRHLDLDLQADIDDHGREVVVHLSGNATFVTVPDLAELLDSVPDGYRVVLQHDGVETIDHATVDLLTSWSNSRASRGNSLHADWSGLLGRYVDTSAPLARRPEYHPSEHDTSGPTTEMAQADAPATGREPRWDASEANNADSRSWMPHPRSSGRKATSV